jgi:hypothetical protein
MRPSETALRIIMIVAGTALAVLAALAGYEVGMTLR